MNKFTCMIAGLLCLSSVALAEEAKPEHIEKMKAALPAEAFVKPASARKILIYSKTTSFRHTSIPLGIEAIKQMGEKTGAYTAIADNDASNFEPDKIKEFDAILFLSPTGELFDLKKNEKLESLPPAEQERQKRLRQSLLDFVSSGKGIVGIHAATDISYQWPEFGKMMGGYFDSHPWHTLVKINVEEPQHELVKFMGVKQFEITDEIYQFTESPYDRSLLRILMSLDQSSIKGKGKRKDNDYPVTWINKYGKGRVFYCSLGHREEIFWNPMILKLYLSGIQFATGDIKADASPRKE